MENSPLRSQVSVSVVRLEKLAADWVTESQIRQHSRQTLAARRFLTTKFLWFLRQQEYEEVGTREVRAFLAYLNTAHERPEGRWGDPRQVKPLRPRTAQTYFTNLRTFFTWLVAEDEIPASPMERLRAPIVRQDQIQPFRAEELEALLEAARKGRYPRRDEALILFLLDTVARSAEARALNLGDLDLTGRCCRVLGKGNKHRTVYFGRSAARALLAYLRTRPDAEEDAPLFRSERGPRFSDSGLRQLVERLGETAGLTRVRCSPHSLRHTGAVMFLRNGGNVFALQTMLGHERLTMTQRYVALAAADVENQHRQFSPGDRLKRR